MGLFTLMAMLSKDKVAFQLPTSTHWIVSYDPSAKQNLGLTVIATTYV